MASKAGYCSQCGKKIIGTVHKVNDKTYCGDCYEIAMQSLAALEKAKKELYDYIKDLFGKTSCPETAELTANADEPSAPQGKEAEGGEA